jgi:hypothetical protein
MSMPHYSLGLMGLGLLLIGVRLAFSFNGQLNVLPCHDQACQETAAPYLIRMLQEPTR